MNDYPLSELQVTMNEVIQKGGQTYFKWTCQACGERVTSETPNMLSYEWKHEGCPVSPGYVTDVTVSGGNFLAIYPSREAAGLS